MKADPRKLAGRYVITELDDDQYYWHAFLGDERVNGGLCEDYLDGVGEAKRSIAVARANLMRDAYFWDAETFSWLPKADLRR